MPEPERQVHDDMQITQTTTIERMLESADHLIEKHQAGTTRARAFDTPHLPEGWVLYSVGYALGGSQKGWRVKLIDTGGPFRADSIVDVTHNESLDAALREANHKILAS